MDSKFSTSYFRALKSIAGLLLVIIFAHLCISFLPKTLIESSGSRTDQAMMWTTATDILWGIIVNILYGMLIPYAVLSTPGKPLQNLSLMGFLSKHVKLVTIESLRTMPRVLIGFLLLIIPGLMRVMDYMFVPWVAQLHKGYLKGDVDALEKSKKLIHGNRLKLGLIYFMLQIPIALLYLPNFGLLSHLFGESMTWLFVDWILNAMVATALEVACMVLIFRHFLKLLAEKDGSHELAL